MQLEELEKQFNHKLSQHEMFDIDNNQLWSSIEQQLPSKKEERAPIFFFLLARLLIGLFLFGLTSDYHQSFDKVPILATISPIAKDHTIKEESCTSLPYLSDCPEYIEAISLDEQITTKEAIVNYLPTKQLFVNPLPIPNQLPLNYVLDSIETKTLFPQLASHDQPLAPITFPEKKEDHFLTFTHAGISYSQTFYKSIKSNYHQIRQLTETPINNWSIGSEIFKKVTPNFFVGMGVSYHQQWTRFNYQGTTIQEGDSIFVPQQILIDPIHLDSLQRWDWNIPQLTATRSIQQFNQLQSISIPVYLAYLRKANRWQYGLMGGINLNWIVQQKGKYITPSGAVTSLEEKPSFQEFQFGVHLSPIIFYQLSPNIQLGIRPSLYYHFSNQSLYQEFKQQSLEYGISIGIARSW